MAGFQVPTYGRFWVSTEVGRHRRIRLQAVHEVHRPLSVSNCHEDRAPVFLQHRDPVRPPV
jgi:hypothetical protein